MILFDLDGTLIDSNGIWSDVDRVFLARRGLRYTQEYRDNMAHMIFPLAAAYTKEYGALTESCEAIMDEWMALAADRYAHVPLKSGARELLEQYRRRGERMALFTSAVREHCETALRAHGLEVYFERVIYAADLGMNKSSPEAFRLACEALGVSPADCVLIDDSVRALQSAKACGARAVGVYDDFYAGTHEEMAKICDVCVHELGELL